MTQLPTVTASTRLWLLGLGLAGFALLPISPWGLVGALPVGLGLLAPSPRPVPVPVRVRRR